MKILVTGASGFIGLPLVKELAIKGHQVLALSRSEEPGALFEDCMWINADLSNLSDYQHKIVDFAPEVLVHLAWEGIPDYSFQMSLLNLNHSLNLLKLVSDIGSCNKILVSGSCWEFNRLKGECLESEVGKPKDHFTWAKHSIRSWLDSVCNTKGISLGWMRIFYAYGPRQRSASLIPSILNHLKSAALPSIRTPNNANDFIYIDDVVSAFVAAVEKEFPNGNFNIGSGASTSVLSVCRLAERIVRDSEFLTNQLDQSNHSIENDCDFWANIDQTKRLLDWYPQIPLDIGIKRTWEQLQID